MSTKQAMPAQHEHQHEEPETAGCGEMVTARNRYFTGKFMTARDFSDEQRYHLSRRQLHNRLLHGQGIVCGLRVLPHPNPTCLTWVIVRAGVAIDCCGRELIVERDTALDLAQHLPPAPEPPAGDATAQQNAAKTPANSKAAVRPRGLVIAIRYHEVKVEFVPALYSEGTCDPTSYEANRVREEVTFEVFRLEDRPGCWPNPDNAPTTHRDDCADDLPAPSGVCLEPECTCGGMVALAHIQPIEAMAENENRRFLIDMVGRREMNPPPEFLTHIVLHSWPHGGTLSYRDLRDRLKGELSVHFDRKLMAWPPEGQSPGSKAWWPPRRTSRNATTNPGADGLGINRFTFSVTYQEGSQDDLEVLAGTVEIDPNDPTRAVFTIDPDLLPDVNRPPRKSNQLPLPIGTLVFITLKCNYILDCHGKPVDGDLLEGTCPTGDGIPGGVFESWFQIAEDEDDEYDQKESPR